MEEQYEYLMLSELIDRLNKIKEEYGDCYMLGMVNGESKCLIAIEVENNQDCIIKFK